MTFIALPTVLVHIISRFLTHDDNGHFKHVCKVSLQGVQLYPLAEQYYINKHNQVNVYRNYSDINIDLDLSTTRIYDKFTSKIAIMNLKTLRVMSYMNSHNMEIMFRNAIFPSVTDLYVCGTEFQIQYFEKFPKLENFHFELLQSLWYLDLRYYIDLPELPRLKTLQLSCDINLSNTIWPSVTSINIPGLIPYQFPAVTHVTVWNIDHIPISLYTKVEYIEINQFVKRNRNSKLFEINIDVRQFTVLIDLYINVMFDQYISINEYVINVRTGFKINVRLPSWLTVMPNIFIEN